MTRANLLTTCAALAAACLLLPFLVWQLIPDRAIRQFVTGNLAAQGLHLKAQKLGTTFPFALQGAGLSIGDDSADYLAIDRATVRLRLLPLFTGKLAVNLNARTGTGTATAAVTLYPRTQGTLFINNLEIAAIPAVTNAIEGSVKGVLNLDAAFRQTTSGVTGEAKLRINSLALSGAKVSAMPLPDLTVSETRGLLKLNGSTIDIATLAMQADGIYLRLSGKLPLTPAAPLNLTLELLPSAELLERQKSVFLMMFPYLTAPGHYSLPISGTLASPQLAGQKPAGTP